MNPRRRAAATALALSLLLTLLLAWPVLEHPRSTLWGHGGDSYGTLAGIEALARGDWAHAPRGSRLQPLVDFPAAILARSVGSVAAYNQLLLASFPLATLAGLLLAFELGIGGAGAVIASLLFAFSPYHFAHALEHLDQAQVWPAALVAWSALRFARRPDVKNAAALGALYLVAALVNWYFLAVLAPLALVGVVVGMRRISLLAAVPLVAGILAAVFLFGSLARPPSAKRTLAGWGYSYAAHAFEYLRPAPFHPLLPRLGGDHGSSPVEQTLTLGLGALVLAAAGARRLWREAGEPRRALVLLLLAGTLSLGLSFAGSPPPLRATARFGLVVQMIVALLAGAGVAALGRSLAAALVGISAFEYFALAVAFPVEPVEATRWLDANARMVASFPARPFRFLRLYRPVQVGHAGVELLESADAADLFAPGAAERLAALGVSHVVWHGEGPGRAPDGLEPVADYRGARIFTVRAEAKPVSVRIGGEFGPPEEGGSRWLRSSGGPMTGNFGSSGQVVLAPTDGSTWEGELVIGVESPAGEALVTAWPRGRLFRWRVGRDAVELRLPLRVERPLGVGVLAQPSALFRRIDFEEQAEVRDGLSWRLGPGFLAREPGGARWLAGEATLIVETPPAGATLCFSARALDPGRRLRVAGESFVLDREWREIAVPVASGELILDGGPPLRLDHRHVSVAIRHLRLDR